MRLPGRVLLAGLCSLKRKLVKGSRIQLQDKEGIYHDIRLHCFQLSGRCLNRPFLLAKGRQLSKTCSVTATTLSPLTPHPTPVPLAPPNVVGWRPLRVPNQKHKNNSSWFSAGGKLVPSISRSTQCTHSLVLLSQSFHHSATLARLLKCLHHIVLQNTHYPI